MIVCNFRCITRLDVAIVHILVSNFEELGFVQPRGMESALFFSDFRGATSESKELLQSLSKALTLKEDLQLVEAVPIYSIVRDPVYSAIVAHNIFSLREKTLSLLRKY